MAHVEHFSWEQAKGLPLLCPADIVEADRYRMPSDKVLHLVSAYLKRKYVGVWWLSPTGKPLADHIHFNVSHTAGLVVLALADAAVGVDVERVRPVGADMIAYVATPDERAGITVPADFFGVWTAKESLVKAIGTGFDCKPNLVPAMPLAGAKIYQNNVFYTRQTAEEDWVLSVTLTGATPFDWTIEKEMLP